MTHRGSGADSSWSSSNVFGGAERQSVVVIPWGDPVTGSLDRVGGRAQPG